MQCHCSTVLWSKQTLVKEGNGLPAASCLLVDSRSTFTYPQHGVDMAC